mgnify:CR=1 FL=1
MSIFMNYDNIKGETTAKGHEDWIDLLSLDWGVQRGITARVGTSKDREATSADVSELRITKYMDNTTPYLFKEAWVGKGKAVQIHLTKTGDTLENYMEYTLKDCMISGYRVNTEGERPVEEITLSFTKIEQKYTPYDDNHKAASPVSNGYDVATASMI